MHRILVVEDDNDLREAFKDTLELGGYHVECAEDAEQALKRLALVSVDMVVSDVNMPGMDGIKLLREAQQRFPQLPFLLVTAYGSIERSVEAMRAGAVDYIVKPFAPKLLLDLIARQLGSTTTHDDVKPIAVDDSSQQIINLAKRVALTDATVMISGESGTGKEVLARYIHAQSPRVEKPFIAINCAAIPENMLEAILFGYEKGAFTGAQQSSMGKFEQANGGTLLLDEITEMDFSLQAKLLRVLQEQEVEPLGGKRTVKLDVRVIATSNRNMLNAVQEGCFREDLFYRLNVFPLQWKALRDRSADILPISKKLIYTHCLKMGRPQARFSAAAACVLMAHSWPGNIRELDNVIQRALILQADVEIQVADICLDCYEAAAYKLAETAFMSREVSASSVSVSANDEISVLEPSLGYSLEQELQSKEFTMIADCLRSHDNNRQKTAKALGVSERTLRYKLAKMRDSGFLVERRSMA